MPLATEPVNFTWSLPSLTCSHGIGPQGADFRGEFFQKVKETKTTLDRIYLSSLTRNKDKAVIYDYEKWARKGGIPVERKSVAGSQSSALKHLPRPGPIRPLGVDNTKIEAALQCGLWDEPKQRMKNVKVPHFMARVKCYDFEDDYQNDTDKLNRQGAEYALDSSKVFRVMQEETREQATQRLNKGKCGSLKTMKRTRRVSPSDHVSESEDDYMSSQVKVTIEEEHSKRRGGTVTKVTRKQKLDFSTIKKRGVTQSDTVDYRLPKLNSKPITREDEEQLPYEHVVKLPLLEGYKKGSSSDKKKGSKRCKKLSKRKKKSGEEGDESSMRKNTGDDIETGLGLDTPIMEEVASKLSDISTGGSGLNTNKSSKHKLYCKKETDDEAMSDYPFMSMGVGDDSDSDEECLCDECLELMASAKQPSSDKKPIKSILSPRRRKQRTASTGSGKSVSFALTENLEDIRLISPLAVRNENTKRYEEEERRERLKQRDIKRRERRQRERERFAALNQKFTKKTVARPKTEENPEQSPKGPETTCSPTSDCEKTSTTTNEDSTEMNSNDDNVSLTETKEQNGNEAVSQELPPLDDDNDPHSGIADDTQTPSAPNSEVREVEALLLDPHEFGRLYEETVLEKGNGKITVAQLGYRIKSIFDRDLPPPASPKPYPSTTDEAEIIDHETDTTLSEDEADDKDEPFVTKCVDWNETTESSASTRSATPVEKTDMSDFIMSMKNCRYIRWSKSYVDMLEKMEQ